MIFDYFPVYLNLQEQCVKYLQNWNLGCCYNSQIIARRLLFLLSVPRLFLRYDTKTIIVSQPIDKVKKMHAQSNYLLSIIL